MKNKKMIIAAIIAAVLLIGVLLAVLLAGGNQKPSAGSETGENTSQTAGSQEGTSEQGGSNNQLEGDNAEDTTGESPSVQVGIIVDDDTVEEGGSAGNNDPDTPGGKVNKTEIDFQDLLNMSGK